MNPTVLAHVEACQAAHTRLMVTLDGLNDEVARRPSLLPGWSVGHVLTHVARNADSHVRRMEGAIRDEVMDQYEGGYEGREADIEAGAGRSAPELVADVRASNAALEAAWDSLPDVAWSRFGRAVGGKLGPMDALPFSRLREVEVHHLDLGLDYGSTDWSDAFVSEELPRLLASLPDRLADPAARRRLCAWLLSRSPEPGTMSIEPWG
jgi:maleylpyruvate isomerase